jgi:hypothetical protein
MSELLQDGWWNQYCPVKANQNVGTTEKNEIVQRAGIGDDNDRAFHAVKLAGTLRDANELVEGCYFDSHVDA